MPIVAQQSALNPTLQDMILAAYQMLGYYAPNETLRSWDAQLGLQQLGFMLDAWSNESLMCYSILEESFPLVVQKASYTIGLNMGADVNLPRPIKILEGIGSAYLQDFNGNNYRVDVVTREQWNQIANRSQTTTSDIPDTLFYDKQFPMGIINLWPTPIIGYTLFFDSYRMFTAATQLSQSVNLPPGYALAIESNLAILLAPFLKNITVSQDIKDIATYSKKVVKRSNIRNDVAEYDKEITKSGQPNFNIYSGRYQ